MFSNIHFKMAYFTLILFEPQSKVNIVMKRVIGQLVTQSSLSPYTGQMFLSIIDLP